MLTYSQKTAADQNMAQMQQMNPQQNQNQNVFGPGTDPSKMFDAEAENLEVMVAHEFVLDNVEQRVLATM